MNSTEFSKLRINSYAYYKGHRVMVKGMGWQGSDKYFVLWPISPLVDLGAGDGKEVRAFSWHEANISKAKPNNQ